MRPALLLVLALWWFCMKSKVWGEEQRESKQGMSEQSTLVPYIRNSPTFKFSDGMLAKPKCALLLEIADMVASDNHAIRYILECTYSWCRHVVRTLLWGRSYSLGSLGVLSDAVRCNGAHHAASTVLSDNRYAYLFSRERRMLSEDRDFQGNRPKLYPDPHAEYTQSHGNVWDVMHRMSLLDVVDDTSADRQANAVRRQGIDSALLRYAGLTISGDTQTGAVYNVGLPPSLAGIRAQVTRVIPATFTQADFMFNQFVFPVDASFSPIGDFVVMVYREISSFTVYTLPSGYQYGGPVVGIISSSSNTTSLDPAIPPGSISLPANAYININLPTFTTVDTTDALCASFTSNGSMFVSNLASAPNVCRSSFLGDFALVVKASSIASPTENMSPPAATAPPAVESARSSSSPRTKSSTNWKLIVGATCLALAGLAFLVAIALIGMKVGESVKHYLRTRYTGNDEALEDSLVGGSLAPTAAAMRTKPALEIDVARFSR